MDRGLVGVALAFYCAAAVAAGADLGFRREGARRLVPVFLGVGAAAHGFGMVAHGAAAGTFPITDVQSSLSFLAWLMVGAYLVAQVRYRVAVLAVVVSPVAFALTLPALAFYGGVSALPPNLRSPWLPVHVTLAVLGNALFGLAFCVSILYVVQDQRLKRKRGATASRLPSLETLDELNYRFLAWGFLLLTLGILSGSVWAELSWGRFWSWEPRFVTSLITWGLYAALLQGRLTRGWRGRKAARWMIASFALLAVFFVTVNALVPGRHGGSFG